MALSLAGCAKDEHARRPVAAQPSVARTTVLRQDRRFAALEGTYGARLGVYAMDTGSGIALGYRADERFAFCSTFKTLAVAAVLHANPLSHLDQRVRYSAADIDSISPITKDHVATGMTIRQLCDAAIRYSDGTAGNLLMRDLGGPARLTAYLRGLGDTVSRMDRYEPGLNRDRPGDPRDTTSPRAVAEDYRKLVLGEALPADKRALVLDWLIRTTTGTQRIPAGVPRGWRVAHKTGTGDYGRANDIAVAWPPGAAPLVMAIMSDRPGYHTDPKDALVADAAACVASALG